MTNALEEDVSVDSCDTDFLKTLSGRQLSLSYVSTLIWLCLCLVGGDSGHRI